MLGCNDWGQLGLGQQTAAVTPTFVKGLHKLKAFISNYVFVVMQFDVST